MTATVLIIMACSSVIPVDDHASPQPDAVRAAVEKAIPLILKVSARPNQSMAPADAHHVV